MRHTQMSQVAPQWGWHHDHQGSPDMALGDRIRQLRKEHGWSQAELGHKIDADPAAISRYEGGRITPSADALVRLAETFDVSLDHLLIDDIPRRPLRTPENILGDHLHQLAHLDDADRDAIIHIIDGLIARSRVKNALNRDAS